MRPMSFAPKSLNGNMHDQQISSMKLGNMLGQMGPAARAETEVIEMTRAITPIKSDLIAQPLEL